MGDPAHLVAQRIGDLAVDERPVGRQRGTQPAQRHSQVVDALGLATAYCPVRGQHLLDLGSEVGVQHPRHRLALAWALGGGSVPGRVAQDAAELALRGGDVRARFGQQLVGSLQQSRAAVDQLDLPLTPGQEAGLIAGQGPVRVDAVVGDFREHPGVVAEQGHRAAGVQRGHWSQLGTLGEREHQVAQRLRRQVPRPRQRQLDLLAGIGAGGQLEVPSLVAATAAASEGDPMGQQVEAGSVEVRRLELDLRPGLDRQHAVQPGEVGQGRVGRRVVGAFDFSVAAHPDVLAEGGERPGSRDPNRATSRPARNAPRVPSASSPSVSS